MRIKFLLLSFAAVLIPGATFADLQPFTDYEVSDAVWSITIESYSIFRSIVPQSGDFDLLLVVKFSDTEDLAPNKERYDAFMKEWGEQRNRVTEYAQQNYPAMGAYRLKPAARLEC